MPPGAGQSAAIRRDGRTPLFIETLVYKSLRVVRHLPLAAEERTFYYRPDSRVYERRVPNGEG